MFRSYVFGFLCFAVLSLKSAFAAESNLNKSFLKEGNKKVALIDLIKSYESSQAERTKIIKQLGLPLNACRPKLTKSIDEMDTLHSVERRLVEKSAKLRLSFLIENLKTTQKPRRISTSDLAFLNEVEDCTSLTEELVTLSQLSANWDIQDQSETVEE
jgi:hypothetical protein